MKTGYAVGVFDCLHYGHKNLLCSAMKRCDRLIVGVHTDTFVAEYKRVPSEDQETRRGALIAWSGLPSNHIVCIDDDHLRLVQEFDINEIYHGDDWDLESYKKQVRYHDGIEQRGVRICMLSYTRGLSSSVILSGGLMNLDHKECFVFDLDNTLMMSKVLMPFAKDILQRLHTLKKSVFVVTNNNRYTPEYIEGLFEEQHCPLTPGHVRSSMHNIHDVLQSHTISTL